MVRATRSRPPRRSKAGAGLLPVSEASRVTTWGVVPPAESPRATSFSAYLGGRPIVLGLLARQINLDVWENLRPCLKRSSRSRCHHLFKTFHAGPAGPRFSCPTALSCGHGTGSSLSHLRKPRTRSPKRASAAIAQRAVDQRPCPRHTGRSGLGSCPRLPGPSPRAYGPGDRTACVRVHRAATSLGEAR